MRKTNSSTRSRLIHGGLASGAAVATILALTAAPALAEPKLTLSSSSGPALGGNTITAQAPTTGPAPFLSTTPPIVQFQAVTATVTACTANYKTPATVAGANGVLTAGAVDAPTGPPATVTRINAYRIAVKVPAGLILPNNTFTTAKFNMCVYDSTSTTASTLLASAPYSIATKPLITNISPTAGPALGGYQVSVSGSGFTTGSTATLGNVPLTNVSVNTAGTLLTGTAPSRTAGTNIQLVITSQGGTVSSNDLDNGGANTSDATNFTLSNGIVATPNTAPKGTTPDLDIFGVGFSAMTFADTTSASNPTFAGPHVVLVSRSAGYAQAAAGTGRPITVCADVLVLSDTELICKLLLTKTFNVATADATGTTADVPNGAYNLQIIQTGDATATDADVAATAVTSGSTFTVAPY